MDFIPARKRPAPWFLALLVLTNLLTLGMGSPNAIRPKPANTFALTVSQPKSPVCIGETRLLTVTWSPASRNDILSPLGGPRVIYAKSLHGSLDRYTTHPVTISGTTTFTYTAEQEGNDIITIQAMNGDLETDGVAFAEVEVKKCDYRFNLYAQLDADPKSGDVEMGFRYILRAKGRLTSDNASIPGTFEAYNVIVHFEAVITSFNMPECAMLTWTPGSGTGLVDVRAIPGKGGSQALTVQFSPPQDMTWNIDMTAACDGEPITVNRAFQMTTDKDPWIEAEFPAGIGSKKVEVDMFARGVKNITGAGYQASYSATLTLERVEQK